MAKRRLQDLQINFVGHLPASETLNHLLPLWCRVAAATQREVTEQPEIEIAFAGREGRFSNRCNCRLLIVPPGQTATRDQIWHADLIFSDQPISGVPSARLARLNQLDAKLQQELGSGPSSISTTRIAASAAGGLRYYAPAAA
jgi:hypothetical protein